jgi:hypothetical protein
MRVDTFATARALVVYRGVVGMRVAIFAVSLLGIASVQVSHAQGSPTVDGRPFPGTTATTLHAAPATAMNGPSFTVSELTMPTVTNSVLARRVNTRSLGPVGTTVISTAPAALAAPVQRLEAAVTAVAPMRASAARQPPVRSAVDHLLAGVVAVMLIAYQLRRKHRVLRPHPFTT